MVPGWRVGRARSERARTYLRVSRVLCWAMTYVCSSCAAGSVIDISARAAHTSFRRGEFASLAHEEETQWVLSSYRSYITREDDYSRARHANRGPPRVYVARMCLSCSREKDPPLLSPPGSAGLSFPGTSRVLRGELSPLRPVTKMRNKARTNAT